MNHPHSTTASEPWHDPLWSIGDYSYTLATQSTLRDAVSAVGHHFTADFGLNDFNAADDITSTLAPITSMGEFTELLNDTFPDDANPWSMPVRHWSRSCFCEGPLCSSGCKAFFDPSSVASQRVGDPLWTGISPFATHSVEAALYGASPSNSSTPPTSEDRSTWFSETGKSTCVTPPSFEIGSEAGWSMPEYGVNLFGVTTSLAEWGTSERSWSIPASLGNVEANDTMTFAPTVALGKRSRGVEVPRGDRGPVGIDAHEMPPQKRARGSGTTNGILKAARPTVRTRRKPVARIPQRFNGKPKETGRGAEKLATLNAQGVYHKSLPGPSSQQGWAVEAADGELTWVEGSVRAEAVRHSDSMMQQQRQEERKEKLFKIPQKFKTEHKALLVATEADFARGTVQEIKCRLCPNTNFKKWEDYKRHCNTIEAHPLKIFFCELCGNFFARGDSLRRHQINQPPDCASVTPERAAAKRRDTQNAHDEFMGRLEGFLKRGEDIGKPFSQIIKKKYPESSKKCKRR